MSNKNIDDEITIMSMLISQVVRNNRLERLAIRLRDDLIALHGEVPTHYVLDEDGNMVSSNDLAILDGVEEGEPG
jgi:hypothetical protein